jgi:hypothetical protein
VYGVDADSFLQKQIDALPAEALAGFAELRTVLELAPWSGDPINADHPHEPVRVASFGPDRQGLVTYLVLDEQRRVELLQIAWLA